MPSHAHIYDVLTGGAGSGSSSGVVRIASGSGGGSQNTNATGVGNPFNVMQPFQVVNWMIKT